MTGRQWHKLFIMLDYCLLTGWRNTGPIVSQHKTNNTQHLEYKLTTKGASAAVRREGCGVERRESDWVSGSGLMFLINLPGRILSVCPNVYIPWDLLLQFMTS